LAAVAKDHLRRVLEHQEKIDAERQGCDRQHVDPQLKMPLIGEVRRPGAAPPPKRARPRKKTYTQPRLED
jgi:hypothetical protein